MEENKPFVISRRLLLLVYAIIPAVLFVVFMDAALFDRAIKQSLGLSATTAAIYILFLELPHIIGSFMSYADAEYLRYYRKRIFVFIPLLLFTVGILLHFFPVVTFAAYLIYTMYHSFKQQTGIAGMLVGRKDSLHTLWTYSAIGVAVIGNFCVFAPHLDQYLPGIASLTILSASMALFALISFIYCMRLEARSVGLYYVIATSALLGASYFCIMAGYVFFAVFLVRFVHDVTAFIFYSVHDSNRNMTKAHNFFYKFSRLLRVPSIIVTPVFAILIAHYVQVYAIDASKSAVVLVLLGCAHYYIEGFMWKRESLHRKQLQFAK